MSGTQEESVYEPPSSCRVPRRADVGRNPRRNGYRSSALMAFWLVLQRLPMIKGAGHRDYPQAVGSW